MWARDPENRLVRVTLLGDTTSDSNSSQTMDPPPMDENNHAMPNNQNNNAHGNPSNQQNPNQNFNFNPNDAMNFNHMFAGNQNFQQFEQHGIHGGHGGNDQQGLSLKELWSPQWVTAPPACLLPMNAQNFVVRPSMLPCLPHFHGLDQESPYLHLKQFEEVVCTML